MITDRRLILSFANRKSLQYRASRNYFKGSVVLYTDDQFYEAMEDIVRDTLWEDGNWKPVGGSPSGFSIITNDITSLAKGGDYGVDVTAGTITITVPDNFKKSFRVFDWMRTISYTNRCIVDFSAFTQGVVEMVNTEDDINFDYVEGMGWVATQNNFETRRVV